LYTKQATQFVDELGAVRTRIPLFGNPNIFSFLFSVVLPNLEFREVRRLADGQERPQDAQAL
jgi:hypothetical protein